MRRLSFLLLLTIFGTSQATDPPAPPQPPLRVLMLFPGDLLMPWALTHAEISKSAIRAAVPREIDFFAEGLDALRMPGAGL